MQTDFEDRCVGTLIAGACGDILGAAVEGMAAYSIRERHGEIRDFLPTERGFGCYTDDTQMTLALARSIVDCGRLDAAHASSSYARMYEPSRGYGAAASVVMQALMRGVDHRDTGTLEYSEGSFGNGGAMRIAPVGLVCRMQPNPALRAAVQKALVCTHVHPEAVDAAHVQAGAIALLSTTLATQFDPGAFLVGLKSTATTLPMSLRLTALSDGLNGAAEGAVMSRVGNGIRAVEAVAAALWSFITHWDRPEECIIHAVSLGGDTDTVASMAGSLAGALHGSQWIPPRWFDNIENGPEGRDTIIEVARKLSRVDVAR